MRGGTYTIYLSESSRAKLERVKKVFDLADAVGFSTVLCKMIEEYPERFVKDDIVKASAKKTSPLKLRGIGRGIGQLKENAATIG
ncbi:MAG: hypothetical protein JNM39_16395 [Bdellovibrionaceae bacterium]|nr:hypothetical protein [Pseudobdellovibrionaceae bacterium]